MKFKVIHWYILFITIIYIFAMFSYITKKNHNILFTTDEKTWLINRGNQVNTLLIYSHQDACFFKDVTTNAYDGDVVRYVEYLKKMYGIQLEIYSTEDIDTFNKAIEEQNYDLYYGLNYDERYESKGFFTTPLKSNDLNLYSNQYEFDSITDIKNSNIAVLNQIGIIEDIQTKYPTLENASFMFVKNIDNAIALMQSGVIDGFISSYQLADTLEYQYQLSLKTVNYQWRFFVTSKEEMLYKIINKSLLGYLNSKSYTQEHLSISLANAFEQLKLSESEYKYVTSDQPIHVGIYNTYPPFDYNEKSLTKGLNYKYLEKLSQILKKKFIYHFYNDYNALMGDLDTGVIDITTNVSDTNNFSVMNYSLPFMEYNNLIITNSNDSRVFDANASQFNRIGINRRTYSAENINNLGPFQQYIIYDNVDEAVALLNYNQIDCFIENEIVMKQYLERTMFPNIKVLGEYNGYNTLSFGTSNKNPYIQNILNHYIKIHDFEPLLKETNAPIIYQTNIFYFVVASVLCIGLVILIYILVTMRRRNIMHLSNEASLQDSIRKNQLMVYALVDIFDEASSANDYETGTHVKRVTKYALFIADQLGIEESIKNDLQKYASLHDLGKIGINEAVLKKPGKLTPEEFDAMKQHVRIGSKLVFQLGLGTVCENIIRFHHEKWDGTGYLNGLKGLEIPIEARIVALADVYDALRMQRVYKKAFTHETTTEIIQSESGKHFDPEIVAIYMENHLVFDDIFSTSISTGE